MGGKVIILEHFIGKNNAKEMEDTIKSKMESWSIKLNRLKSPKPKSPKSPVVSPTSSPFNMFKFPKKEDPTDTLPRDEVFYIDNFSISKQGDLPLTDIVR